MRTKLYMIALAAITMMLGSCSESNSEFSQDFLADTPIKLNVSVDEPTTRAGYSDDLKPDAFWLWVYHDDNHNDKYNYDILAEKVGILGRPTTLTHILLIRLKTRLLCFGQI